MTAGHKNDSRIWFGAILVLVGAIWLLDNLNFIPYYINEYIISWQSLLIVVGIYFISARKKIEPGIVLIAVGSIFLLHDLRIIYIRDIWHIFWPALIILIGVSLILRRNRTGARGIYDEKKNSLNYIDDIAVFGGGEKTYDSKRFNGGKITAVFGGSQIDLRNAELAEGVSELDIFCMFGGTEIIVPPDWTIHIDVVAVLGGFSDKRESALKVVPNPDKVLVLKGFVMFGGGDLKLAK